MKGRVETKPGALLSANSREAADLWETQTYDQKEICNMQM